MTQLVAALLNAVINEMRPRLAGCNFRLVITNKLCTVSSYKPYAWGYLDGQERKQKTSTRMRIAGMPAAYVITIFDQAWDAASEAQRKLMLAVLIAPITAAPPGAASLSANAGQTYRVNRRWGLAERIAAAEETCRCTVADLAALAARFEIKPEPEPEPIEPSACEQWLRSSKPVKNKIKKESDHDPETAEHQGAAAAAQHDLNGRDRVAVAKRDGSAQAPAVRYSVF